MSRFIIKLFRIFFLSLARSLLIRCQFCDFLRQCREQERSVGFVSCCDIDNNMTFRDISFAFPDISSLWRLRGEDACELTIVAWLPHLSNKWGRTCFYDPFAFHQLVAQPRKFLSNMLYEINFSVSCRISRCAIQFSRKLISRNYFEAVKLTLKSSLMHRTHSERHLRLILNRLFPLAVVFTNIHNCSSASSFCHLEKFLS